MVINVCTHASTSRDDFEVLSRSSGHSSRNLSDVGRKSNSDGRKGESSVNWRKESTRIAFCGAQIRTRLADRREVFIRWINGRNSVQSQCLLQNRDALRRRAQRKCRDVDE